VRVERKIDIAAPPEEVYETVMDPRRLDEWVTIHVSVDDAPSGPLKEGSEMRQCLKLAGTRFHVDWKVVTDERPSRVEWEGKGPVRSKARVVYDIEPNGNGTRFCYMNEFKLPGGALGRLAGGGVRGISARESERSLERLKKLLES
jgi:carbon monoxide dehydrogenase subunit G